MGRTKQMFEDMRLQQQDFFNKKTRCILLYIRAL